MARARRRRRWDRRFNQGETPHQAPVFEYDGHAIPVSQGKTTPPKTVSSGGGTVDIKFDAKVGWQADRLAASEKGAVEVLLRNPNIQPISAVMTFGPAYLAPGGYWAAEADTALTQTELFQLGDGTLIAGTLIARIIGFSRLNGTKTTCTFEAIARCAGADLYPVVNGVASAICNEAEGSARLWILVGKVGILLDGSVTSMTPEFPLPSLETSQILYFSTRVALTFNGHDYQGPLSPRVAVPYIHPAPESPEACFDVRSLSVDYYGRTLVRAEARGCELLDVSLNASLTFAAGIVQDPSGMTTAASPGLYGAQRSFEHRTLFDAFTHLAAQPEGQVNTLGVCYVRPSDTRESSPSLNYFAARRVD